MKIKVTYAKVESELSFMDRADYFENDVQILVRFVLMFAMVLCEILKYVSRKSFIAAVLTTHSFKL